MDFAEIFIFIKKLKSTRKLLFSIFVIILWKIHFLRKWAPGHQKPWKRVELRWFYKAWRIRAARDQKARKVAQIAQNILRFRWKFWFLCKKLEISERSSFCALPKRWYSLSFIGCFSSSTVLFQVAPPFYQKSAEFHHFEHFGCPKVTFWPRIGPLGARLRNIYKHKLLGGFLEAQNRKSAFWTKKLGISLQTRNFVK